jgi:hypothetical protein
MRAVVEIPAKGYEEAKMRSRKKGKEINKAVGEAK